MTNYSEILCTAIDEIVTQKLQGVNFDITKLCTIVNADEAHAGKYMVSDGAIKFDAYCDNTAYRVGQSVYVMVPKGDYSQ